MAKLFSTKTHGVLDYLTAGQLLLVPRALGLSTTVTTLMQTMGVATAVYSLVTRYELGVLKLLPMPAHLALDVLGGLSFGAAVFALGDESPAVRAMLASIGAFEVFAGLSTQTQPGAARRTGGFATVAVDDVVAPLRARGVTV
jgi:hypothetical protein